MAASTGPTSRGGPFLKCDFNFEACYTGCERLHSEEAQARLFITSWERRISLNIYHATLHATFCHKFTVVNFIYLTEHLSHRKFQFRIPRQKDVLCRGFKVHIREIPIYNSCARVKFCRCDVYSAPGRIVFRSVKDIVLC